MIKIFYGDDSFSISKELERLYLANQKDNGEIINIDKSIETSISSMILSVSFFNNKRLFIIKDYLYEIPDSDIKSIIDNFSEISNITDIIFIEKTISKKSKLIDFIKKNGEIKPFELKGYSDPKSFIKKRFLDEGVDIAPLAVERLASFVGNDFWQLSEEINKLILYKKGEEIDPCIDSTDVDLLVKSNFEANIFELLDNISAKNIKKSTELINSFLESGENAIYILTMIEKQFRNIAMAKFENGISDFNLAKKAGIHPYVAKKSISQARSYSKEDILNIYKKLIWADLKLKSGFEPNQILLRIIN